jgi:hypothetical protein
MVSAGELSVTGVKENSALKNVWEELDNKLNNTTKYAASDSVGGAATQAISDGNGENIAEHFDNIEGDISVQKATNTEYLARINANTSNIAIDKTTLGYTKKNLLNEAKWLASVIKLNNGTCVKDGNAITLTATGADCFTYPCLVGDGDPYQIPVKPNTKYILSWESDSSNSGKVIVFFNGTTTVMPYADNSTASELEFTTNSDTTFITFRVGVAASGESITYSNIMLRYADITDDTYEPYVKSIKERFDGQSLVYSNTTGGSSPLTATVSNLFVDYSAVICNMSTSNGSYSIVLPLRYIKSLGTSEYYTAEDLMFYYVDDSNIKISTGLGQTNPTINSIRIVGLY